MEAKEMLGKKYGRLLVKDYKVEKVQGKNRINNRVYLLCKCECGTEKFIRKDGVISGLVVSCG